MTSIDLPDTRMQTNRDNAGETSDVQTAARSVSVSSPIASDDLESRSKHFIGRGFLTSTDIGRISSSTPKMLSCFLCMDFTGDSNALQHHLVKNHEVKTEVMQKFMTLVTDDILPKRKTQFEQPEVLCSEPVPDLPAGIKGQPYAGTTSLLSICDDSDGLVIDLDKQRDLVDGVSVGAANGTLTGLRKEIKAGNMELQDLTARVATETPPTAEPVPQEIQRTSTGPIHFCWHSGCHEFFPNAADVQHHYLDSHTGDNEGLEKAVDVLNHYLDAHAGDNEGLGLGVASVTMKMDLQCAQCHQVFHRKEDFNKHRYCHEMNRAAECSTCQHRFQSIGEFRRHMQLVHQEELTPEQQALYEASVAAASSLALLGASGLENMTAQSSSKRISPGRGKALRGAPCPQGLESQSGREKTDGRLDENSNSCLQAKFEGGAYQGSVAVKDERGVHKCEGNCGLNGMGSKCQSCRVSWANGALTGQHRHHPQTEKSRRKRSIPTKAISCPPDGKSDPTPTDLSVLDLTGRMDTSSVDSETPVTPSSTVASITSSSAPLPHRPPASLSAATDRPFRCAVCKVSYSQRSQLDGHLSSQQHVSRCAKAVDSTARQAMTTPAAFATPYSSGDQGTFADLLRQQNFPIGQLLQYGIPFMNPMMSPVLSGYTISPMGALQTTTQADVCASTSSTASVTTCQRNSADLPLTMGPLLKADSAPTEEESSSKSTAKDDSVGGLDLMCTRSQRLFPSVELANQHHLDCSDLTSNILAPDPQSFCSSSSRGSVGQTMMESILQKIGYECVKQFNEFRQKPKQQVMSVSAEVSRGAQLDDPEAGSLGDGQRSDGGSIAAQPIDASCNGGPAENRNVYVCPTCSKRFSDIFVLKSHQEIVHTEIVPIDVLEKLQQDLRAKCQRVRNAGSSSEDPKVTERSRIRRQESTVSTHNHPTVEEDEMKLRQQQQQMQLAAAYQSMQLGLMMSMGWLPQVPQRLPGPAHIAAISELFAQQQYPILDPMMLMQLQQQQNKSTTSASAVALQSQLSAAAANQKSARTRISEQQLQILRANFDINNSPTEEQIQEMSEKTGLVMKVIKHWFRNTLFKERQRNKDSPYNFNNPPATMLNLDDYEKGQAVSVKLEPLVATDECSTATYVPNTEAQIGDGTEALVTSKPFCSSESAVRMVGCYSDSSTISDGIGKPMISGPSSSSSSHANAEFGSGLIRLGAGLSPMTSAIYGLSPPVNWQERRAGRTRFSNQQIQVLQEFFDRNPYPKDDEVESLSRVLGLGIRVIVVWFQNARQRVRKTEGQGTSASTSECPRTSGQYQCGKCSASFDHHMDLLRHQMSDHHGTSVDTTSHAASQSDSNEVFVDDEEAASRSSPNNEGGFEALNLEGLGTASTATRVECDRCEMGFDYEEQLNSHQRTIHGVDLMLPRTAPRTQWEFGSRKSSEDGTAFRQSSDDEEHRGGGGDRRMRTTLAQDQLDYLYEKFTVESNPSRPALEEIAAYLGLKPRVVQVWFQNTRARERRGQHRVNAQKTLVKCGFCESVFRGKAALDAHVTECHASHLNVLAYPIDLAQTIQAMTSSMEPSGVPPFLAPPPLAGGSVLNPSLQSNMNYLYEKSLKQYMTKLSNLHPTPSPSSSNHSIHQTTPSLEPSRPATHKLEDLPLDLTTSSNASSRSNAAINVESEDPGNRSSQYQPSLDDSYSETYSENDDAQLTGRESTSPPVGGVSKPSRHHGALLNAGKRYRTQMSSLQIRVMRAIFNDYKTPSLAECESLGQQIGLPRRVVQVWFQNSRAKMKKSSFLGLEKPEGSGSTSSSSSGGVFTGICVPLAECGLCNVTYGVDHTMQDHLFTKRHIDRVLTSVNTSEFRHSFLNSADGREMEGAVMGQRKVSSSGGDFPANLSETLSGVPNSSGNSDSAATNILRDADKTSLVERKQKRLHEASPKIEKDQQNENKKIAQNNACPSSNAGPVGNSLRQFLNVPPASAADFMGMMMPYLYQAGGIPAIFPGLAPIQLLQAAPNMLPGLPNTIFNPAMCGIQLSQLQIPKQAIEQIQDRLRNKACSRTHYSEDCLSSGDLHNRLSPTELASLSQQTIHVGFICKRCHLVFPQANACTAHQSALCYKDADKATNDAPLKLEQLVYHCTLCRTNCSTVTEYKAHCAQELHRRLVKSDSTKGGKTTDSNGTAQDRLGSRRGSREEEGRNGESVSLAAMKVERIG